jgi:hypothetical protein
VTLFQDLGGCSMKAAFARLYAGIRGDRTNTQKSGLSRLLP